MTLQFFFFENKLFSSFNVFHQYIVLYFNISNTALSRMQSENRTKNSSIVLNMFPCKNSLLSHDRSDVGDTCSYHDLILHLNDKISNSSIKESKKKNCYHVEPTRISTTNKNFTCLNLWQLYCSHCTCTCMHTVLRNHVSQ